MNKVFKQIPIESLRPGSRCQYMLLTIDIGKFSAVCTDNGEILGFMTSLPEMEKVLAHEDNQYLQPEAIAQSVFLKDPRTMFQDLARSKIIKITRRTRPSFALISPELQNYLPLPLIGEKEAI